MKDLDDTATIGGADIYERLRAEILCCKMRPGALFQERLIAERFSVSKSPVRDALIKLQEQNLVEVIPRKGYRVTRISVSDAREMYEMRLILEREAIVRMIDTAETGVLNDLNAFRGGQYAEGLGDWIAHNRDFHISIARNCGNHRLARAGVEVIEQFDRLTYMSVTNREELNLADRAKEHVAIIDAIQARDKRRAVTLSRDHLDGSRKRLLEALENASIVL